MTATVTDLFDRISNPHELTPRERLECLVLATMNDEKAELMRDDQPALKAFFQKNAEVLRHVAAK